VRSTGILDIVFAFPPKLRTDYNLHVHIQHLQNLRMENSFFSPIRSLREWFVSSGYTERQLAVPVESFMNQPWDYSAFRTFATTGEMWKILRITNDEFIWVEDENTAMENDSRLYRYAIQRATFTVPSGETHILVYAKLANSESLVAGTSSIFWHAMATSNCVKLKLVNTRKEFGLCSGPALSQLLLASPSLHLLEFEAFAFKEADCHALATLRTTDLKVTFHRCSFDAQGAEETFIQWLRNSQVVTKLERCTMESGLISALSGNSSVKSLTIFASRGDDAIIRSLAGALSGNQGIENLCVFLTEEASSLILRSLCAHPRIQSVSLRFIHRFHRLSASSQTSTMNAVLKLVQCNTVVHTIDMPQDHATEEFFQNSIVPRLEMNRFCFEHQRHALMRVDHAIRGQLLGRALHVVRYNPDLLFRFVSENVPAFVRSDQLVGRALHVVRYNPDLLFRSISDNVPAFFNWTRMVLYSCCCCSIGRG
jgi:hypothetical protein